MFSLPKYFFVVVIILSIQKINKLNNLLKSLTFSQPIIHQFYAKRSHEKTAKSQHSGELKPCIISCDTFIKYMAYNKFLIRSSSHGKYIII